MTSVSRMPAGEGAGRCDTAWAEENIEQAPTFLRLPRQHHKHLKSTNRFDRLNE